MKKFYELMNEVTTIGKDRVITHTLDLVDGTTGEVFSARGSAKCGKGDHWEFALGADMARNRAIVRALRKWKKSQLSAMEYLRKQYLQKMSVLESEFDTISDCYYRGLHNLEVSLDCANCNLPDGLDTEEKAEVLEPDESLYEEEEEDEDVCIDEE